MTILPFGTFALLMYFGQYGDAFRDNKERNRMQHQKKDRHAPRGKSNTFTSSVAAELFGIPVDSHIFSGGKHTIGDGAERQGNLSMSNLLFKLEKDASSLLSTSRAGAESGRFESGSSLVSRLVDLRKTRLHTKRSHPYQRLKAAAAPVSTVCPHFSPHGFHTNRETWSRLGFLCGVEGESQQSLEEHINRVWKLVERAHRSLHAQSDRSTLYVFVAPEWALGRRYPERSNFSANLSQYAPPLHFKEMEHIIQSLLDRMRESDLDFRDWLLAPGTIYWGVPIPEGMIWVDSKTNKTLNSDGTFKYAVFNSAPVFFGGELIWMHNKFHQSDAVHSQFEVWGYELVASLPSRPNCTGYGEGGRLCGTIEFSEAIGSADPLAGEALLNWGLLEPAFTIMVNGLAVSLDICLDHGMGQGYKWLTKLDWLDSYDIQLLISSGMTFQWAKLNKDGLALKCDGFEGPHKGSRLCQDGRCRKSGDGNEHLADELLHSWTGGQVNNNAEVWTRASCAETVPNMDVGGICQTCRDNYLAGMRGKGFDDAGSAVLSEADESGLCRTEAGNWVLLKLWTQGVLLPQPQQPRDVRDKHSPAEIVIHSGSGSGRAPPIMSK